MPGLLPLQQPEPDAVSVELPDHHRLTAPFVTLSTLPVTYRAIALICRPSPNYLSHMALVAATVLLAIGPAMAQTASPPMNGGLNQDSTTLRTGPAGLPPSAFPATAPLAGTGAGAAVPPATLGGPTPPNRPEAVALAPALPPLAPTQFQQFVQEATGKSLPLFGYSLFERSRFSSLTDAPVPASYVLGPGDELDIKVWGSFDLALRVVVDRQGQISLPRIGPITVAGTRAGELDGQLRKQLSKVYSNFELSASVGRIRSIQVYVVGQARSPGVHTISSLSTLVSAVFETGGPSSAGSLRTIQLVRGGTKLATVDLYKFISEGHAGPEVRLLSGDVLVVPPAGPRVAVTGALDTPTIVELASEQESLQQVLAYTGASTTLTTPHKVLVERVDKQRTKSPREVQERSLDAAGLASTVRDGDVLTLFRIRPQFENAVTLRGNVSEALRHAHKPGMRVSDLIPEAEALVVPDYYVRKNALVQFESGGAITLDRILDETRSGLLPEINWDYAAIERKVDGEVRSQLIPFNLGKAVKEKDPQHNLELRAGDVVTIFSVKDIAVPREKLTQFVRIGGEVRVPGLYQLLPGEKLPDLVRRAGGFTEAAFPYATVFTRESTRQQQQANLEQAVRKLEGQLGSQSLSTVQNTTNPEAAQTLQAQLAAQRLSIERLSKLKASGRIALEMEPTRDSLPPLLLEDGDVITVPPRPSFVSVFGAVLAENTFIHRANTTVEDYLNRAGPTRDADLQGAMIIRADGSVMANTAQRSWLGWGNSSFMSARIYPGDSIFVPELLDKRTPYTQFIQGAKDWTQLFYQFGLGAAAVRTLRN